MPKATTCNLAGQIIEIEEGLQLRDDAVENGGPYPEFRCCECGEFVQPQQEGTTGQRAHYEHRRGTVSPECLLRSRR
jgi:hypothetical protein